MLATLHDKPFDDDNWLFEIKFDGYRAIAEVHHKDVKLYSRNGISFAPLYPHISEALAQMNITAVLDGEIVVIDKTGRSDFQNLQNYNDDKGLSLVYYVFDILRVGAKDVTGLQLAERKLQLKKIIKKTTGIIRYSDHVVGKGKAFFKEASKNHLEGMIAKRSESEYHTGARSKDWLKVKNVNTDEVVIAGYTAPRGSREHFGALILATKKKGGWIYAGHTGTGFTQKILKELSAKLKPLIRKTSPFDEKVKVNDEVTWVQPKLVCNIKFTERTRDGLFRHPVYQGLRIDKKASEADGADRK
ncbi:MAG: non-homologous end-joining DNA ligase [Flavitalea sp.]